MTTLARTWTYRLCETCLKNSHEKVEMIKEEIKSTDVDSSFSKEMWVCPVCGSTKRL